MNSFFSIGIKATHFELFSGIRELCNCLSLTRRWIIWKKTVQLVDLPYWMELIMDTRKLDVSVNQVYWWNGLEDIVD